MTTFTLYKYNNNLDIIDLGQGDGDKVTELLSQSLLNAQNHYEYMEEGLSNTFFGLKKTDGNKNTNGKKVMDFLEITVYDDHHIDLYSDRLIYSNNPLLKILTTKMHITIKSDKAHVNDVIDDYLNLDRASFEHKYQQFYCR